jgi:hypothetical protein
MRLPGRKKQTTPAATGVERNAKHLTAAKDSAVDAPMHDQEVRVVQLRGPALLDYPLPIIRDACEGIRVADNSLWSSRAILRSFEADVVAGLRPRWDDGYESYSRSCRACQDFWEATHWPSQPWATS